jgi:hypothetical protein
MDLWDEVPGCTREVYFSCLNSWYCYEALMDWRWWLRHQFSILPRSAWMKVVSIMWSLHPKAGSIMVSSEIPLERSIWSRSQAPMVCHVNAFVFRVPQIRDTMGTSFHATEGVDRTNVGAGAATQSIYFQCGEAFEAVQDMREIYSWTGWCFIEFGSFAVLRMSQGNINRTPLSLCIFRCREVHRIPYLVMISCNFDLRRGGVKEEEGTPGGVRIHLLFCREHQNHTKSTKFNKLKLAYTRFNIIYTVLHWT